MLSLAVNFGRSVIHLCVPRMSITTMRDGRAEADMTLTPEDALRLRDWLTANLPAEIPKTVEDRYRGYMSDVPRRSGYTHRV